ncbi:MAG: IS1634 family transposase, partial [Candidatus Melainabacteria bacterium]|nr:IS1634 family transposase [Candidatus Melainabacteria bacterium]
AKPAKSVNVEFHSICLQCWWVRQARYFKGIAAAPVLYSNRNARISPYLSSSIGPARKAALTVTRANAVSIVSQIRLDDACEAGPVHVAHQIWKKLELDAVLDAASLPERAKRLTEIEVINRLVEPGSEHSIRNWVSRTALPDIFREELPPINDTALYKNLDKLHPEREKIEQALAEKEITLFNLKPTIFLYDLTSTYFEGLCARNEKAKHGYSRDKRSDCRQVVVGLVLNQDGFPTAHEIFDGNRVDCTTVDDMLTTLDKRAGDSKGHTVVVDRGMSGKENLAAIKAKGNHYIVASRQPEREQFLAEFESEQGWEEVIRDVSPNNQFQKKSSVAIKRMDKADETLILCLSGGRAKKDKAIREKKEKRLCCKYCPEKSREVMRRVSSCRFGGYAASKASLIIFQNS